MCGRTLRENNNNSCMNIHKIVQWTIQSHKELYENFYGDKN